MVNNTLSLASLSLLLAWGSLHAAEPAGRVLLLQGSAVAVRGAQDVALARGSLVESGDLLRVAADSSLQVRFTDESVVALRANTQFKIDDYQFSEQGSGDKSFFSLLKGGMRTITGLIGKRSPEAYQMRGITATIGVRGTHFTAVNCAADCTNADGSKADDGLYGGVTDGRIVVANKAGESEFVRDQYFVVTSTDTLPKALLAPPAFLRDRLDGLAKAKGKAAAGEAAEVALAGGSASTSETSSPIGGAGLGLQTALPANDYVPADTPRAVAVVSGTAAAAAAVGSQFLNFIEVDADNYKYVTTGTNPGSSQGVSTYAAQLQLDPIFSTSSSDWSEIQAAGFSTIPDFYRMAYSDTSSATYNGITYNNVYSKTASTDVGFSAAAGNVSWGRFSEHEVQSGSDGSVTTSDRVQHWAFSNDIVTAAPTSGIFTYNPIGGTSPTDMNGNVGSMTNRGQWTVNFGAQTLATTQAISWSIAGSSYSVSVPTQTYQLTTTNLGGSTLQMVTGAGGSSLSSTTACSGGGCVTASTQLSVIPFGAQAQGMGAGLATTGMSAGGTTMQQSSSVQIYQR